MSARQTTSNDLIPRRAYEARRAQRLSLPPPAISAAVDLRTLFHLVPLKRTLECPSSIPAPVIPTLLRPQAPYAYRVLIRSALRWTCNISYAVWSAVGWTLIAGAFKSILCAPSVAPFGDVQDEVNEIPHALHKHPQSKARSQRLGGLLE